MTAAVVAIVTAARAAAARVDSVIGGLQVQSALHMPRYTDGPRDTGTEARTESRADWF